MNTSPKAVRFDDDSLWVSLSDGRTIAAPLAWFPRLLEATPEQRTQVELSQSGWHWDALDEDISVAGLLAGRPDLLRGTVRQSHPRQPTRSDETRNTAQTARTQPNRLMLSPKELQKALKQSARQAQRLADAFGLVVPTVKPKASRSASKAG